ncbi:MAG: hypothetical protein EOO43_03055 [Flavobacterium sp.]|nr:MAG: hypothetical protein EOO43_03055 [Flavobacterium sp.]
MKKVLIISPYFPPSNAPDMQRVRMSLPFFKDFGWDAEVVIVDQQFSDLKKDELLMQSLPANLKIHKVGALNKKITSKIGLGSLALRSMIHYKTYVNRLLKTTHFDLIYFSTTLFPLTILGSHWKRRFGIPFVIDMQDPWHSDYYKNKPANERPKKYWFSYRLNKYLEPISMCKVDGLISVSENYITQLEDRYPRINNIPSAIIPFGFFSKDMEIAQQGIKSQPLPFDDGYIHIAYVGVAGTIMKKAITILFSALKALSIANSDAFNKLRLHFIGTSYAPAGTGTLSVLPIASKFGVDAVVSEQTDRVGFYDALKIITSSNALLIIGTDSADYTASKLYPYILAEKPLLSIFHPESSAVKILRDCLSGISATLENDQLNKDKIYHFLEDAAMLKLVKPTINWNKFNNYSAKEMTSKQCELFDKVISESNFETVK